MGAPATPSVRLPLGAVPRPGPAAASPSSPPRGAGLGGGGPGVRASVEARDPRSRAQAAQPTRPHGPGALPAPPARRSGLAPPSAARGVPRPRVPAPPGAHGARGRGRGGVGGRRAGCTHHSRPSTPARSAGADGADAGFGFHINSFFPGPPFLVLRSSVFSPLLPRALSLRVSLSPRRLFLLLRFLLLLLLRLYKRNGKCKNPGALGRRRLSAECSADSQLQACFY